MRNYTCDPSTQVIGASVLGFLNNANAEKIRPLAQKHGLSAIDAQAWYPLRKWLDVLNELASGSDSMFDFVAVGMGIAENTPFPPEVENLPIQAIFANLNNVYQAQHQGGDVGQIEVEEVSPTHLKVTLKGVVYPDDLEYGVAYGFARRFLPRGTNFTIHYDDSAPRLDEGGETTVIHISW